ncbi:VOC family protein [Glutamicibacter sp. NPDC087344]|uniref:VOC family protein n=1 Tax=Glutamicibacter sp. NPDC087344 TaxID=3363994 RepID=UPI0038261A56
MSTLTPMPDGNWFENVEKRPHPWPGLEWLTTALVFDDVAAAVEFYGSTLGFVPIAVLPFADREGTMFARLRYRGINFTLNSREFEPTLAPPAEAAPSSMFYVYVDDVPAATAAMREAGASVLEEPTEQFWGDLRARVRDPFGYIWDLARPI